MSLISGRMKPFLYKFSAHEHGVETGRFVVQYFSAYVPIEISGAKEIEQVNAIHKADAVVVKYGFIS
ncbi:hypothetical protein J7E52_01920 [Bacillus sp. ISL-34]|uniref:hypothetical protein n=1 Tax=Bacillus sp. ISL-34 TaxID=2819121 RepID=UPI001BE58F60|nr:hypothetical protein [Bacillus sp. ISL-34]MBT2645486.1 hypothetical protein [Bacillus sp. ISL-34]